MTRPTTATPSNRRAAVVRFRGFTLLEMVIVMGIVVLLAGILLPMISKMRGSAERARAAGDLQAITTALEQYKTDLGDYPRPNAANTGASLLVSALIAPSDTDGKVGPGFRLLNGTKNYGPYLQPDRFKIQTEPITGLLCLMDSNQKPILYAVAARVRPRLDVADGYVADKSAAADYAGTQAWMYNFADNAFAFPDFTDPSYGESAGTGLRRFKAMLGDFTGDGAIKPADGETARALGSYVLWAAGPDQTFGPVPLSAATLGDLNALRDLIDKCDDVTNFRQ